MVTDVNVGEVSSKDGFQDLHRMVDGNGDADALLRNNATDVACNGLHNGNGSVVQNVGDGPIRSEETKPSPCDQDGEEELNGSSADKHDDVVFKSESAQLGNPAVHDAQPHVYSQTEIVADPELNQESQLDQNNTIPLLSVQSVSEPLTVELMDKAVDKADQPGTQVPRITNGDAKDMAPTTLVEESQIAARKCAESDDNMAVEIESQSQPDSHKDARVEDLTHVVNNSQGVAPSRGDGEGAIFFSGDCCSIPVGGAESIPFASADVEFPRLFVGSIEIYSFDCCSVPVGSCQGRHTLSSASEPVVGTATSDLVENHSVDDDEPEAEKETLDAEDPYYAVVDTSFDKQVQSGSSQIDGMGNFEENGVGSQVPPEVTNSSGSNPNPADAVHMEPSIIVSVDEGENMPTLSSDDAGSEIVVEEEKMPTVSSSNAGSEIVVQKENMPNISSSDAGSEIVVEDKHVVSSSDVLARDVIVSEDSNAATVSTGNEPVHFGEIAAEHGLRDSVEDDGIMPMPTLPGDNMGSESTAEDISATEGSDMLGKEAVICTPEVANLCEDNGDKSKSQESENFDQSHKDEGLTSSHEASVVNALGRQNAVAGVVGRPFNFLVRQPRFEDTNLREQIEHAQLQVDEKTKKREVIRAEINRIRVICKKYNDDVEAAVSKERAARELLRSKRQEMDSVQSMINRVKNAISVEDIDGRVLNMQRMIEHETLPLKEEKQIIREIRQLKQLREQLSSNAGREDEVQQALDEKDKIEERLKALKQEADSIRDKVSKLEDDRKTLKNKLSDEFKRLSELQTDFKAADDIRQNAYAHLQDLRRQLYEKNKYFRKYKAGLKIVNDYTSTGDRVALSCFCDKQVESFMELWNTDVGFRKEYIRCNSRSTLRRLGTTDGRSIGPDDKPPVIPVVYDKLAEARPVSQTSSMEQEKPVVLVEAEQVNDKSAIKVVEQKNQTTKPLKAKKGASVRGSAVDSGRLEIEETIELDNKRSKEEDEMARREAELRKKEEAAKLKELQRLEEKAKAKEAMERKKRNVEKAKARAALRAQKEAEEREREREKRAKKKEKKKAIATEVGIDGIVEGETTACAETENKVVHETEAKDQPNTATKRPQRAWQLTKQTKARSIPPPLRNRSKRRVQSWIWVLVAALLVFALFMLGNSNMIFSFRQ